VALPLPSSTGPTAPKADEAAYALRTNAGDLIWIPQPNRHLRLLDLVPVDEDDSAYAGLSRVEAA
jgi:hypothetical protein